jgi:hypothetical protein
MRIILGTFLFIISFLGTIFLSKYQGSLIASPVLWYLLFVLIGILGVWLFLGSFKRADKIITQIEESKIQQLKANSEKIKVEFDFCEFKNGSYSHEVRDENISTINLIAATSDLIATTSLSSLHDPTIIKNIVQSSLIYSYPISGKTEKYISQSFPFDQITLKFYVLNHKVTLYIDRFDRRKYFFNLEN